MSRSSELLYVLPVACGSPPVQPPCNQPVTTIMLNGKVRLKKKALRVARVLFYWPTWQE